MSRFFVSKKGTALLNVQMNEFPEGHVKVPSWELFILHIAKRSWSARGRLSGTILHAKNICRKNLSNRKGRTIGSCSIGVVRTKSDRAHWHEFFYYSCIDYAGKNECKMLQYRLKLLIGQQKCLYICYRYLLVQLQKLRRKLQI